MAPAMHTSLLSKRERKEARAAGVLIKTSCMSVTIAVATARMATDASINTMGGLVSIKDV